MTHDLYDCSLSAALLDPTKIVLSDMRHLAQVSSMSVCASTRRACSPTQPWRVCSCRTCKYGDRVDPGMQASSHWYYHQRACRCLRSMIYLKAAVTCEIYSLKQVAGMVPRTSHATVASEAAWAPRFCACAAACGRTPMHAISLLCRLFGLPDSLTGLTTLRHLSISASYMTVHLPHWASQLDQLSLHVDLQGG